LLSEPREMDLSLPRVAAAPASTAAPATPPDNASLQGTLQIAARLDWDLASRIGKPPLISSDFSERLGGPATTVAAAEDPGFTPDQRQSIVDYLAEVQKRELAYERVLKRTPA
jgi:hypothetical protein